MSKFKVGDIIQYKFSTFNNFVYEVTRNTGLVYDLLSKSSNSTYTVDISAIDDAYILIEGAGNSQHYLTIPCPHEFVSYTGFRETYNYCIKCDQKQ